MVLIQLQESSRTIQEENSASPVNSEQDVVYRVRPEGGAMCTHALKFTCYRGREDLSLLGDVTPFVCEVLSLLCAHKKLLAHILVGHPPQSGDRLSKCSLPVSVTLEELRG